MEADRAPAVRRFAARDAGYRNILVIQTAGIGDCLMTTPGLAALKQMWPECEIDTVSAPGATEVFAANPHVRYAFGMQRTVASMRAVLRQVRSNAYDLLIDYHCTPRTFWISALSGVPVRLGHDRQRINWRRSRTTCMVERSAATAAAGGWLSCVHSA
ncbi:hypothetical protein BH24PSE2_BH24PSE2_08370 [soil metagenome]